MSDEAELSISELRRKRAQAGGGTQASPPSPTPETTSDATFIETTPRPATTIQYSAPAQPPPPVDDEEKLDLPFDPWRLPGALLKRWYWLVLAACVFALLGGIAGFWRAKYFIHVNMTLRDLSTGFVANQQEGDAYKPPELSSQSRVNFLTSSELLTYVSTNAVPPVTERGILANLNVTQEKNSENITITIAGKNPPALVALANTFTSAAVKQSREAQRENPNHVYTNFTAKISENERLQAELNEKLANFRTNSSGISDPVAAIQRYDKERTDMQIKLDLARGERDLLDQKSKLVLQEPIQKSLQEAEARLAALLVNDREDHPDVKRAHAEIANLNQQLANLETNSLAVSSNALLSSRSAQSELRKKTLDLEIQQLQDQADLLQKKLDVLYEHVDPYSRVKSELDYLEKFHKTLTSRKFEAQQYRDNAEGYYIPPAAPAILKDVDTRTRYVKAATFGFAGGFLGFAGALALVLLTEIIDPRLKTAADVRRVTQLPVLATLGNLDKLDDHARKAWAFRTWTILSGTLTASANRGTVCGFISCMHGEGRTKWVSLLVEAARERGFEVTKLDFGHVSEGQADRPTTDSNTKDDASQSSTDPETKTAPATDASDEAASQRSSALSVHEKNQKLAQAKVASVIHIQLPGLVWNLERRIQFQTELDNWRAISSAVILIDLPPASVPEAILLAENLPQVIWLVDSGKPHARETRLHLETLRHARCKLVGAVLNHEPEPLIKL
ncbi:MAG: Polysaccharide export protein [Pedosphaera sp.]|nr:Polysaccharide export protein [Pedosphaera sp.]